MSTVFVYSQRNQKATAPTYFDFTLAAFQRCGAIVLEEERFLSTNVGKMVPHGDRIVNFYCDRPREVLQRCMPQFRWNYAIDEVSKEDGRAYATKIKQCKDFDCSRMVITFTNPKHLANLHATGISHVGMPFCPARIRPRTTKPRTVAAYATYHPVTYPERTRVKDMLVRAMGPQHVHEFMGDKKTGEAFAEILDGYQFGIVCKAGFRDRLVAKYVEYGASHVLPIGDCPSYMPLEMKQTMLNTEGRDPRWILGEVSRLIGDPKELSQRQEAYSESVARNFNILFHAERVVKTIESV